ncbi:GGDEF domain-containing protein [Tindallia californiensis]|uniref:Diguanylate cyclase (GGDEF) domain-containing protein n=1 Tax=Tindallia californiensis TaxID=159292 RepID=A0A1H3K945_9FIRM|nr:GGDEF domain-containing protein [Tindallia californiensis]SDY48706.1 diguanylate cyclase (GGDEF) domain-containing protein [Tindallia californiensis]
MKKNRTRLIKSGYIVVIIFIFLAFVSSIYYAMDLQKTHQSLSEKNLNMILLTSDLKTKITSQQYHLANFFERNDRNSLYFIEQNDREITGLLRELFSFSLTEEEYHWLNVINKSYEATKLNTITLTSQSDDDGYKMRRMYHTAINAMSVAINFSNQLTGLLHEDYEEQRKINDQKFMESIAITSLGALVALVSSFYFFGFFSRQVDDMEIQGTRDGLTGIYNKKTITMIADQIVKKDRDKHRYISVALLDLDHFKMINDTYGHLAGDVVLRELATILQKSVRSNDFCGRFGGEEFLIIFTDISQKEAWKACERIREQIAETAFCVQGEVIHITVTIGLAFGKSGDNTGDLLKRSDKYLYIGKRKGRNRTESEEISGDDRKDKGDSDISGQDWVSNSYDKKDLILHKKKNHVES